MAHPIKSRLHQWKWLPFSSQRVLWIQRKGLKLSYSWVCKIVQIKVSSETLEEDDEKVNPARRYAAELKQEINKLVMETEVVRQRSKKLKDQKAILQALVTNSVHHKSFSGDPGNRGTRR